MLVRLALLVVVLICAASCGGKSHFEAVGNSSADEIVSGDIIIVSGGIVLSTVTPFPLHKISLFSASGEFKKFLYEAKGLELLYGGVIDPVTNNFHFGIDNIDRVDKVDLHSGEVRSSILDANLSGATIRSIANLSSGDLLVTESTTVLEKYTPAGVRSGAPFPLTIPTAVNNIKSISGDRFIVTFTANPDSPRVYSNDGVLLGSFDTISPCTVNCDPWDVVELSDGRFAVNSRVTNAIYLYSATFTYVGVLYLDTAYIIAPSGMSLLKNGNLLACGTTFNTCEELKISGNTATRVGSVALINNASVVRQPLTVSVVP